MVGLDRGGHRLQRPAGAGAKAQPVERQLRDVLAERDLAREPEVRHRALFELVGRDPGPLGRLRDRRLDRAHGARALELSAQPAELRRAFRMLGERGQRRAGGLRAQRPVPADLLVSRERHRGQRASGVLAAGTAGDPREPAQHVADRRRHALPFSALRCGGGAEQLRGDLADLRPTVALVERVALGQERLRRLGGRRAGGEREHVPASGVRLASRRACVHGSFDFGSASAPASPVSARMRLMTLACSA